MITVKLSVVPGPTNEFTLESGSTISSLLAVAGQDVPSGYALKHNGVTAANGTSTSLADGDKVFLVTEAKGNA
jgi:hypothetical protein